MADKDTKDKDAKHKRSTKEKEKDSKEGGISQSSSMSTLTPIPLVSTPPPQQQSTITPVQVDDASEEKSLNAVPANADGVDEEKIAPTEKSVLEAFEKIIALAKEFNIIHAKPELVFIGKKGAGKTTLIGSILGHQILHAPTARHLIVNAMYNAGANNSQFVLRRDFTLRSFSEDVKVAVADTPTNVAQRNQASEKYDPIVLNYPTPSMFTSTFIDTPGFEGDKKAAEILSDLVRPTNRTIVLVRDASDVGKTDPALEFVKKADPNSSRTITVYTKLNSVVQAFQTSRDANKFFSAISEPATFFVTLLGGKLIELPSQQCMEMLVKASRRDLITLSQLQMDSKHFRMIGLPVFLNHLSNAFWKHYQEQIPLGLQTLRKQKSVNERDSLEMQKRLEQLKPSSLRSVSAEYVGTFLKLVSSLIEGSCEGNPILNGQTLADEQVMSGISLGENPAKAEEIQNSEKKLYGGQQFARLLSEFKYVSDHCDSLSATSLDDLFSSPISSKIHNAPNIVWSVSDIARQHSQNIFMPLIEQLVQRAVYIIGRLPNIALSIMMAQKKTEDGKESSIAASLDDFPYFLSRATEYYTLFVESCAKTTLSKCRDEFYSTKTLCWDLTENTSIVNNDVKPSDWANDLFKRIKERITRNTLAKLYNFFLVPIQQDLWRDVQSKVSGLGDEELSDLFKLPETRKRYEEAIKSLKDRSVQLVDKEKKYKEFAGVFSYQK